ncbi:D-alanine--D-alanine ligase family protein [Clostridium argentinense CDC 2741]|uniref:D-alanine--D-alanine ligase n=1 Tax=Clostridium argentinense CDC 2741 TaxID=1418104 RepID=A0A0C1U3E1_9CLOT|nr:D-alanine--D-alanine ligase [Clostridium argentinense]ARC83468.1 D-alanine--D-alanine ligase [Clostridium argentinense]KIE45978.1 D-alanine--D-alanine ligase family protein [Clostridium argentinense CDC 2741]NFF39084.1 D-alanine--D-alanine ligase [Clostridium argentinense]NFP49496.1 D-alanine--D-alanine ligase [Clostridium argentinense]NFP74142.1 D-alanine--D-alanine ligase [Clostridium argentinense]
MKIGVLMGGVSSERKISILSGKEILNNLDKSKYEVLPIVINSKEEIIEKVKEVDFVFIALHGAFGEDGIVQGVLESISMPYSGCNVLTSALCMNKNQTKRILKSEDITVAPGIIVNDINQLPMKIIEGFGYPMVVKPNNGGSSIGTFLVNNKKELKDGILKVLQYDNDILIEKYLRGNEYTIPMLNGEILPIIAIKARNEFFDYNSKYEDDGAEEIIASLPYELEKKMKQIAKQCWHIFNCKAYVRIDIIVSEGVPYVLELNTLPGMTKNSLFPKSAEGANMKYSELLDKIIEYSLA